MNKKWLSLLLLLSLLLTLCPAAAYAQDAEAETPAAEETLLPEGTAPDETPAEETVPAEDATLPDEESAPTEARGLSANDWFLPTLDGGTITASTYADKTQVLIFYRGKLVDGGAMCYNSGNTIQSLPKLYWLDNPNVQIIAVEADDTGRDDVAAFVNKFAPDCPNVVFAYGGNDLMWALHGYGSLTYAYCAIIQNGQIVDNWEGNSGSSQLTEHVGQYVNLGENQDLGTVTVKGTFQQSQARTMLEMVNGFRTGDQAWFWNSDNSLRVGYAPGQLNELVYDYDLEKVAMQRAVETAVSYGHTRPNGESCFTLSVNGVSSNGENIAYGQGSATEVFIAWREDNEDYSGQGHRRNMLNSGFTAVGFGSFYYNGVYYWVQEFGYSSSGAAYTEPNDEVAAVPVSYSKDMLPELTDGQVLDGSGTTPPVIISPEADDPNLGLAINGTNFPDAAFQYAVRDYDNDGNGYLSQTEIGWITELQISDRGIRSLQGIEHFTALEYMDCSDNPLGSLDMSKNTGLKLLYCYSCGLTQLNLSGNAQLQDLVCASNQLTTLDLSACPELLYVESYTNPLKSLDVSRNPKLRILDCGDTQVSRIDISHNPNLIRAYNEAEGAHDENWGGIYYQLTLEDETQYILWINEDTEVVTTAETSRVPVTGQVSAPGSGSITVTLYQPDTDNAVILKQNPGFLYMTEVSGGSFTLNVAPGDYKLQLKQSGLTSPRILSITVPSGGLDLGQITLLLYGDVNRNGEIEALDVLNLQLYAGSRAGVIAGLSGEELDYALQVADVDFNGVADALDVLNLQLFIGSRAGTLAALAG